MTPIPYLFFKDNCRAAMTAYGEIFGNAPQIMTFDDMPPEAQGDGSGGDVPHDAVMHAAVKVGDGWIYASDSPFSPHDAMAGCNVSVELENEAETRRVWDALSDGAEIGMKLEPQFWTPLFGTLTDRFGIRWMIMQAAPQS